MIHQVNIAPESKRLLRDIVELQIYVLEAASIVDVTPDIIYSPETKVTNFGPILRDHLNTKTRFRDRAEIISNWIIRKKETLLVPLRDYASANSADKNQFIQDIKHDVGLLYSPKRDTFNFAVLEGSPIWKVGAKDFFFKFYDLWDNGFDSDLFSCSISREKFSKQQFIYEFMSCNPNLFICAICDGTAYSARTSSHIYTSIEHFFPRSIYPQFSCHPLNLIPICSICNSYIKGDTDPLVSGDIQYNLLDFILPYQKSEMALSKKSYIAVVNRDRGEDKFKHPMKLELRPVREYEVGNKITAFSNLYKVEDRWSESLHEIEDHVFRRITQYLSVLDPVSISSDSNSLMRYLKALMSQTDLENIGKDPYAFPMVWLLMSYIVQLEKDGEDASIFKTISKWVDQNQERWKTLENHSNELQQRIPR